VSYKNLEELLIHELKDLYDAEHQIVEALPKMQEAASASELKRAFAEHLEQSRQHIQRLEQVFGMVNQKPAREHCKGVEGVIKEGESAMKDAKNADTRDAALIVAAQKVEHYEMATYGSARTHARLCGYRDATAILQQSLDEEGMTDEKLTGIAGRINVEARA